MEIDPPNLSTLALRTSILERDFNTLRERVQSHAHTIAQLINLPEDCRDMGKEMEELRGQNRDLHQLVLSHGRLREEIEKNQLERYKNADAQRERIELKLDDLVEKMAQRDADTAKKDAVLAATLYKKDVLVLVSLVTILVSIIAFFVVPFFQRA